jgi:predicted nuclease of predicted toxin-antitoxin system
VGGDVKPAGFVLDMGISPRVEEMLVAGGHEAVHLRNIGMRKASDAVIVELARERGFAVVTTDTDLATIVALSGRTEPSVITMRLDNPSADEQVSALENLFRAFPVGELESVLVTLERGRYRCRRLPTGTH